MLVRKKGKLPPPVVELPYGLEYGEGVLEMQPAAAGCCWSMTCWPPAARCMAAAALAERAGYTVFQSIVLLDLQLDPPFRWDRPPVRAALRLLTVRIPVCGIRRLTNLCPQLRLPPRNKPLTTL